MIVDEGGDQRPQYGKHSRGPDDQYLAHSLWIIVFDEFNDSEQRLDARTPQVSHVETLEIYQQRPRGDRTVEGVSGFFCELEAFFTDGEGVTQKALLTDTLDEALHVHVPHTQEVERTVLLVWEVPPTREVLGQGAGWLVVADNLVNLQ